MKVRIRPMPPWEECPPMMKVQYDWIRSITGQVFETIPENHVHVCDPVSGKRRSIPVELVEIIG